MANRPFDCIRIDDGRKRVPGKSGALPEGFAEAHGKEQAASDDATAFKSKDEYIALMNEIRESTVAALNELSDEDLSAEAPEHFRSFARPWAMSSRSSELTQ